MRTCTQELCIEEGEPVLLGIGRSCFRLSSEAVLLSWEAVGCLGVCSFLPLFSLFFLFFRLLFLNTSRSIVQIFRIAELAEQFFL